MKVAIVHEWFNEWAGSEQVTAAMLEVLPDADLFSIVDFLDDADRARIGGRRARTSFIQRLPGARSRMERYLPLMPLAVEQFDLSDYDLILSNSHAVAKGVITGPDQLHLSYVESPMRYAWDLQFQYLKYGNLERGLRSGLARLAMHYLRIWDVRTAHGVDQFVGNSAFIARRIAKCYGRSARVIHPPVAVERLPYRAEKEDFYVAASRLVPYKRMDLLIDAFRQLPQRRLVVIGRGTESVRLQRNAPPNVTFLGFVPDDALHDHIGRARAFLFAALEDFGILPVEAQACGTPVIAYGRGGALETIRGTADSAPTGLFFDTQSVDAVVDAIRRFEGLDPAISPADCRANAQRFSLERFRRELRQWIDEALASRPARVR